MADTSPNQNRSYVSNDGKSSTFGRSLVQYIQNRLPYTSTVDGENDSLNPKYKYFHKTPGQLLVNKCTLHQKDLFKIWHEPLKLSVFRQFLRNIGIQANVSF